MFENAFNNIDKALRNDEGLATELDYAEQTSWLLFLKYLDDLEAARADNAELEGREYRPIMGDAYHWQAWAAPKDADGNFDHNTARTGTDLIDFVNRELFAYLTTFRNTAPGVDTLEYKIGEIFSEIISKFRSGYALRDAIEIVDTLTFNSQQAKHELSDLYETRIRRMGNAGRNGGEYYTPRPLIRAMIRAVNPKIGETIYDGACGSAGFLCEAFEYFNRNDLSSSEWDTLQRRTFYGQEKKSLAYVIGIMNMILHGIETPAITHANTLNENVMEIREANRHDIVLANPPFGGGERKEVQHNFPIKSGETAYLFLQHFIRKLRAGGRGAVVIKNTFLSNTDNASVELRKELLTTCNLHTVLDCPGGTFQGAGVKTVVLFFDKGTETKHIWYYQLEPGRSLGKTNPLNDDDLAEFVRLQSDKSDSKKSWSVAVDELDPATWDLSVKNPNAPKAAPLRSPAEIIDDMLARDVETTRILEEIRRGVVSGGWTTKTLGDVCTIQSGSGFPKKYQGLSEGDYPFFKVGDMNRPGNEDSFIAANNYIEEKTRRELGAKVFPTGSVLFPKVGGAIATNKKRKVNQPCCADNNIMGLIPNDSVISEPYLYHWIKAQDIYEFSNKSNPRQSRKVGLRNGQYNFHRCGSRSESLRCSIRPSPPSTGPALMPRRI